MNWLLTTCDGSSGYKTVRLISEADAAKLLTANFDEFTEDHFLGFLKEKRVKREAVQFQDLESTLYPVPDQIEPIDDLLEEENDED